MWRAATPMQIQLPQRSSLVPAAAKRRSSNFQCLDQQQEKVSWANCGAASTPLLRDDDTILAAAESSGGAPHGHDSRHRFLLVSLRNSEGIRPFIHIRRCDLGHRGQIALKRGRAATAKTLPLLLQQQQLRNTTRRLSSRSFNESEKGRSLKRRSPAAPRAI